MSLTIKKKKKKNIDTCSGGCWVFSPLSACNMISVNDISRLEESSVVAQAHIQNSKCFFVFFWSKVTEHQQRDEKVF